jgi:type II secretory pathway component PulM
MSFWTGLNPRERLLLGWGLFALIATILYVFILEPRYQRLSVLRLQVPTKQSDLAWMQAQVESNAALKSGVKNALSAERLPLLTIVEKTSTQSGLRKKISRMQPAQNGAVRVWFNEVQFNPWINWLDVLRDQGVSVDAASISRESEGVVNIRVTLVQTQ